MASKIKGQIKNRSIVVLLFLVALGLFILGRIVTLQTQNKDKVAQQEKRIIQERTVKATRGNIYAADGESLLATSIPIYELGLDPQQASKSVFNEGVDSLSMLLARHFPQKTKSQYKAQLLEARKNVNKRYIRLVSQKITHQDKLLVSTFPILRRGKHKGGLILTKKENRFTPFGSLGKKTVGGLDRDHSQRGIYGVEASFNKVLAGKDGHGVFERLNGGIWLPLESYEEVKATPGKDVVTTLDVNFQDIVESALRKQVIQSQANYGTAIVMEIATGEVKAIANLSKRESNGAIRYVENKNHAVLGMTDPGSTFKLASMMAILEETNIRPNETAVNCTGKIQHSKDLSFTCDHEHGVLTVQEVFEKSCNLGIYKLMQKAFGRKNYDDYRSYLEDFGLDKKVGFQLKGELNPYIKTQEDKTYSHTTMPWMSIGYEMRISPLQMLTFYNAVANRGYWVQPLLVKEIRQGNEIIETFEANKVSSRFCSKQTIQAVHEMLKGVPSRGTAVAIKDGFCTIAGKTGTAQKRKNGNYVKGKYYTSFIGFFPAENPKYSCLVAIDEPHGNARYGGQVCGPVFRNIADRVFSYDVKIHPTHKGDNNRYNLVKLNSGGHAHDINHVSSSLGLDYRIEEEGFVSKVPGSENFEPVNIEEALPDVRGLALRDALPILENKGYSVTYMGLGRVRSCEKIREKEVKIYLN